MKKKLNQLLDSKKFLGFSTVILLTIAGLLTALIFGTNSQHANLTNARNLKEGEYPIPSHVKDRFDNHNGTYKLSLDVEGAASTETHLSKANVLVIYDVSGSMSTPVTYTTATYGRYGKVGNNYVQLYYRYSNGWSYSYAPLTNDNYNGNVYTISGNNATQYNQTRYKAATTRATNAEKVVYGFAEALYKYNEKDSESVYMSLVSFSSLNRESSAENGGAGNQNNAAWIEQSWTNQKDTYLNNLSNTGNSIKLEYGGGTNWEAAMMRANAVIDQLPASRRNEPTYVVFVTDGAPTFRVTSQRTQVSGRDATYYGYGTTTDDDITNYRNAMDNAKTIQNRSNVNMFGIYAYGTEGDFLDDLINYAYTGTDRTNGQTLNQAKQTTATANYYNASESTALNQAIADIFSTIADTLGVGAVTIDDGTTNAVTTTSGDISELLEVDEDSYEYWLSMNVSPVSGENGKYTMTRKNLVTGEDYQINLTDNGNGTITATWGTNEVIVKGTINLGVFKYKWEEANALYNYAPPAAKLENGRVKWDLNSVGTLLNGVTYTVTFDVWASQETYDLVTDLKNGTIAYEDVDANIRKYLHKNSDGSYTLDTNTDAVLYYTDTRTEDGPQSSAFVFDKDIPAPSSKMDVTKKWLNELDQRDAAGQTIDLYLLRDGNRIVLGKDDNNKPIYEKISVNEGNHWYNSKYISTGALKTIKDSNGNITGIKVLTSGHDYTLEEIGGITYYWELQIETVHPMLIDGELTTLIEVKGADIPAAMNDANTTYCVYNGHTFYKINGKVYYARSLGVADLNAYNNRKSNINIKKEVTGDAPAGKEFTFQYKIHNVGDNEVWFSVQDASGATIIDLDVSDNVQAQKDENNNKNGYYWITNTDETDQVFTVKLKDGWNLRFINLGTGSTYEVTELTLEDPFVIEDIKATTIISSTRVLPIGATPVEGQTGKYQYGNTIYTEKEGIEADGTTIYKYYEYEYTANINKQNRKITGSVVAPNTTYQMTYINNYPKTKLVVNKKWFKTIGSSIRVQLYADDEAAEDEDGNHVFATLSADNNWTYTFENLPVKKDGKVISYSAKEVKPEGFNYTDTYKGTEDIEIYASDIPEGTTEVKATVSIDGAEEEVTLNAANNWAVTLTGKEYINKDGSLKTVTIESTSSATISYAFTNRTVEVTNSELTTATVTKEWDDASNQDGLRPNQITVELYADSGSGAVATGRTATVEAPKNADGSVNTAANTWTYTFEGLDKYNADGTEIVYTFDEVSVPSGYTKTAPAEGQTATTIVNKHTPATTEATVKKVWDDGNNQDGIRPASLTVTLSNGAVVTLNAANGWEATIENLPVYANGQAIAYSWTEGTLPTGYTMTGNVTDGTITTITNKHTPETTSLTVKKEWNDASNQDGKRPTELTVTLSDGTEVTLNAENQWTATVTGKPVYADGQKINYTWTESGLPEGYELESNTTEGIVTTIKNKHVPETTSLTVKKVWNDADNQDGIRPTELKVTLSDGTEVTLNAANSWEATVENKPVYANGQKITYTWTEAGLPEGYELESNTTSSTVTTIKNKHVPETTSLTVKKVWNDANNQDGKRPTELKVTLSDGTEVTLNAANGWEATVENKPVYADGQKITYTWTEDSLPEGYSISSNTAVGTITTITNTYDPETTSLTVKKVWNDADNQDGIRPRELKVTLSDGTEVTLNAGNQWTATVSGKPVYANGQKINYTWTEAGLPEGYELESNTTSGTVTTIKNKHVPETTSLTVKKDWDDGLNQDGKRPAELTVTLSDGTEVTLNAANKWTATVENKPVYANGQKITYTWTEAGLPDGYTMTSNAAEGTVTTITNKYVPETTSLTVKKDWNDASNQDGKRPASLTVTLSDGTEVTLNAENKWTATVENKPVYADGQKINYTWTEAGLPEGYELESNTTSGTVTTIKNKHVPETTSLTVKKEWNDASNQDGIRPASLTVTLSDGTEVTLNAENKWTATVENKPVYANGQKITYTWTESGLPEGYELESNTTAGTVTTIKNKHVPETTSLTVKKEWNDASNQDGKRPAELTVTLSDGTEVTLNAENKWTATVENKPVYADGQKINYTWTEAGLPEGYELESNTTSGTITTIKNKHVPETTEATVKKEWNDNGDQDGKRPSELKVTLSNGTEVTLNAANKWTATIENLPVYADGQKINYTWTEGSLPEGYELESNTTEGTVTTIKNKHVPETTSLTVKKVWNDGNNQDGIQPKTLDVTLSNGTTVTLSEGNNWTQTVENLPVYANGQKITYTWTEAGLPEGYELESNTTEGTVTTIKNKHVPATTEATVKKVWDDNGDQDGKRPAELKVTLSNGTTVTLNAANDWEATIENLPVYANGKEIEYTWTEGSMPEGYTLKSSDTVGTVTTITNTRPTEKVTIEGKKTWDDGNNQDGNRPTSITINLLADGTKIESKSVTGDAWEYKFENLPRYKEGKEITYSITEDKVAGYETTVTGYNVTNKYTPATEDVTVTKKWADNNDQDGLRGNATYTIRLTGTTADGRTIEVENDTVTLSSKVESYTWQKLDSYSKGSKITYTAEEIAVSDGYEASYSNDKLTITNTHTPETKAVIVTKIWEDNNNQDGKRPENITLHLFADNKEVTSVTQPAPVKEGNKWTFTYDKLPVYRDHGVEIVYTVTEDKVPNYVGNPQGLTITNTHPSEKISIPVTKQWVDNNNQDGKRTSITVDLYADGSKYDSITLSAANADKENPNLWKGEFTELPKYREGKVGEEIEYTIKEVAEILEGENPIYTGTINGFDIVNTHVPSKKVIEGTKIWSDADNQDGKRPGSITVNLLVNGEVIASQEVSEATEWKYKFENLPEYKDGNVIPYQIDEAEVPAGYSKTVDNYNITNSHTPEKIDIEGTKTWEDENNQDGIRPEKITVSLLADGEEIDSVDVTPNEETGEWSFAFKGLPKYEAGKVGKEIKYTVKEATVEGYEADIPEGSYTITNKHTPETVTYIVSKVWDDEDDNDRIRPESITVTLFANGEEKESVKLSDANKWTHTFGPMAKNKAGKEIEYTIEEEEVAGYELIKSTPVVENKTISQVLTNKHTPEEKEVVITKTWDDENNKNGKRPDTITVYVYADGEKVATITLSADADWQQEVKGLYKFKKGVEVVYTIEELEIEDYEASYDGFNIKNTYVEVAGEEEETPPDTLAKDQETYKVDFLVMLMAGFILTTFRRVIKE